MKTYTASYKKDRTNAWSGVVELSKNNTAITQGRSLAQTKKRMSEAVAALLDCEEDQFELIHEVAIPKALQTRLENSRNATLAAQEAQMRAANEARFVVRSLVDRGFSRRDAGEVLGVSGQRVDQILKEA